MIATLTLIGDRAPDAADVMQLHLEGTVWRAVGASHTVTTALTALGEAWSGALKSGL
jgi:hypothetical protein